ncbi:MAG: cytochrome c peroxidase [Planctomycetota bacterium]|jgi:cytochrome c peroxidase
MNRSEGRVGFTTFHDTRLSHDNTLSCASCHDLRYAGIDRAVTAIGLNGQRGSLNTPTVFNSALSFNQLWNGRADDLESQIGEHLTSQGEMASNWDEVATNLTVDPPIMSLLQQAYPGENSSESVDPSFWLAAIADFERTLLTPGSAFDADLCGDDEAISEAAKESYQTFKNIGCTECHHGAGVGGQDLRQFGEKRPYGHGQSQPVEGGDDCRAAAVDPRLFKVPNLRNVGLTAPYLHTGSLESLHEVVRVMGKVQLDIDLTDHQISRIVQFLESHTSKYPGQEMDSCEPSVHRSIRAGRQSRGQARKPCGLTQMVRDWSGLVA